MIIDFITGKVIGAIIGIIVGHLATRIYLIYTERIPNERIWGLEDKEVILCVSTSAQMDSEKEYEAYATGLGQIYSIPLIITSLRKAYKNFQLIKILFSEEEIDEKIESNLILLGGPEHNRVSRDFLDDIGEHFIVDQKDNTIHFWLDKSTKVEFKSETDENQKIKYDYGLIVRITIPNSNPKRKKFLFSGTHTFGTIGATRYFVENLNKDKISSQKNIVAIIRCKVFNHRAIELKLIHLREFELS